MSRNSLKAVDLNLFKVFASIYNQRNLTRAGVQLAMTQPAVSRALDRLNHVFSEKLFTRIEGEMRPTRMAEMVAPRIFEGLALLEAAVELANGIEPAQLAATVRLGLNDYGSTILLPMLTKRVSEAAPSVFLTTIPATYMDAAEQIERCEIDCAIVSSLPRSDRLAADPLFSEDYVVVCAQDHPLIQEQLSLQDYLASDHLLVSYVGRMCGWVDECLAEMGLQRRVVGSVHIFGAVPNLVLTRPWLCTIPRRLAQHFAMSYPIRVHELPFKSEQHLFYFIRPRHLTKSPVSNWLRNQIVEACQELS